MSFNIKIPFVIATHGKKVTALTALKNKSKAFAFGMLTGGGLFYHDGTVVRAIGSYAPVSITTSTITLTQALHANRIVTLNRAAGIAVTLPAATGTGDKYTLFVGTTFTGASTIKVPNATDYMIGTALLNADGGATTVGFATVNTGTVATEDDTIDLLGTSNSTGGFKGEVIELWDSATAVWVVRVDSEAGGTEATPFSSGV